MSTASVPLSARPYTRACALTNRGALFFRSRRIESCRDWVKFWLRAVPAQLIDILEERNIGAQGCEFSEQQGLFALTAEGLGKNARICHIDAPLTPVCGNGFQMLKLGEDTCGRLRAPAGQTRVTVSRVANQGQIIRD